MDDRPLNDELGEFLQALRKHWWVPLTAVVQFAVLAFLLTSLQTPMYRASTTVLLEPTAAASVTDVGAVSNAGIRGRSIANELGFAKSGDVIVALGDALGTDNLIRLEKRLSVAGDTESDFLVFTASDPDAETAATISSTWASIFIAEKQQTAAESLDGAVRQLTGDLQALQDQREVLRSDLNGLLADRADAATLESQNRLDARINAEQERIGPEDRLLEVQIDATSTTLQQLTVARTLAETGTARVVSAAFPPEQPSNVAPGRNAAIGIILGLIVGLLAVRFISRRDDRLSTPLEIETELRLPVLAAIPKPTRHLRRTGELGLAVAEHPSQLFSEAFNQLRTAINFLQTTEDGRPLVITSASPSEGKTTTAANLALAAAIAGTRTTLVDLDLRRPRQHEIFSVSPTPGVVDIAREEADLGRSLLAFERLSFTLLPAGSPTRNAASLLSGQQVPDMINSLRGDHDLVILDTPPVLAVSDAVTIASSGNCAAVIVVRAGSSTRADVREAIKRLERVGAEVIGVILTGVKAKDGSGRAYYGTAERADSEAIELVLSRRADAGRSSRPNRAPAVRRRESFSTALGGISPTKTEGRNEPYDDQAARSSSSTGSVPGSARGPERSVPRSGTGGPGATGSADRTPESASTPKTNGAHTTPPRPTSTSPAPNGATSSKPNGTTTSKAGATSTDTTNTGTTNTGTTKAGATKASSTNAPTSPSSRDDRKVPVSSEAKSGTTDDDDPTTSRSRPKPQVRKSN